ncbi:DUF3267 domain-containing protein [Bacillus sp. CGMCC 1.16607]|uniref:DUF3267 domain-containing protein n=1 Tax=Bacillus sp. CGMCC 1.16607 TaxID=3351842 RepID=UPI003638D2D0
MGEDYVHAGEQYHKMDATLSASLVNKKVGLGSFLITLLVLILYDIIWGISYSHNWMVYGMLIFSYFLSIILHELLHAFGFAVIGKAGWHSIKIGVMWKQMMPYAHCKVPITVKSYRFSLLLPLVITGLIPLIIGFTIGNGILVILGTLLTQSAGGDILIYQLLKSYPRDAIVRDHPKEIGCEVFLNKNYIY